MSGDYAFITLTWVSERGGEKRQPQRFMVRNIVTWMKPLNGKQGSVIVTNEYDAGDDPGWLVAEPPEVIDMMIERLQ